MKIRHLPVPASLFVCGLGAADTFTVCQSGACDHTSIQAAVDAATNGDIILVQPGTYTGHDGTDPVVDFKGKSLTLIATSGPEATIIDGRNERQCVSINEYEGPDTLLSGFTITAGRADYGGGIDTYNSSPTIANCVIIGNEAVWNGGGVHASWDTNVTLLDCQLEGNRANAGAAVFCWTGSRTVLDGCTIVDNDATWGGGGAYLNECDLDDQGSTFIGNTGGRGGGIYATDSVVRATDTLFRSNATTSSEGGGGGIILLESEALLENVVLQDNLAYNGGGIYMGGGTLVARDCELLENRTTGLKNGGGICTYGSSVSITDSNVRGNTASYGGGLYVHTTTLTVRGSNLSDNSASFGGGIRAYESSLDLSETSLLNNSATDDYSKGGGIYLTSPTGTTIEACSFEANSAWQGGAIYQLGGAVCSVGECRLVGNHAHADGGALLVAVADALLVDLEVLENTAGNNGAGLHFGDSVINVLCSTISGNVSSGQGAGILCWQNTTGTISGCRIEGNASTCCSDGIALHEETSVALTDTRVCANETEQIGGPWVDNGGNVIASQCPAWCAEDLDGNGIVDGADLAALLTDWGSTGGTFICLPTDLNEDSVVGGEDLSLILARWGACQHQ